MPKPDYDTTVLDEAIIAAFIHAEDEYIGCRHASAALPDGRHCPFWCFWNSRDAMCDECEGFKRQVLRHVHSAIDGNIQQKCDSSTAQNRLETEG